MDRCASCGAGLATEAAWCGQCYAPRSPSTAASAVGAAVSSRSVVGATAPAFGAPAAGPTTVPPIGRAAFAPPPTVATPLRTTRWGKTPTTFGPAGRVSGTIALLIPLVLMIVGGLADPFVWGGAGVWLGVVMPWALRDLWKAGRIPAG